MKVNMIQALLASPDITFNIEHGTNRLSLLKAIVRIPSKLFAEANTKSRVILILINNVADPLKVNTFRENILYFFICTGRVQEKTILINFLLNALPGLAIRNCNGNYLLNLALDYHHPNLV